MVSFLDRLLLVFIVAVVYLYAYVCSEVCAAGCAAVDGNVAVDANSVAYVG